MRQIGEYLNKINISKRNVIDDKTVFFVFRKVIEEEFGLIGKQKFIPDYFGKKILFIKVESSVWAAEIWTNKQEIISKINQEIGEIVVCDIKTR